ncbi:MAG: bifunctional diaminohydroxyphosphoribosylaminopyrimidine deaminase/5-amino-6-(5-phosphoribosylamino)uracil reductase RibD [Actinobacteria bacterium]|nr:bifunctional diaminohydroxyphosphoribosylaminopyrimidine deaminase/5-amino-6-(5-phosphoribosylamino)uracil reductase RibD [Actinomycetota bacterium]MBU4218556.1 bifunctional diaminohydroxyphosphoribosylaminopyrimidine deaminase/5-amino-6-(5-phosphoribosylamino)uracil reductase RibD [Actinomycetota bacterium]MBU4401347.1 bifunctional diaminohydroxyphosphoribosylaminopyrimidine deaminase/5-amino-6-(5-phosphoribosylamino)uracil reductase RibD [Actinomycetota bacterium]MCG2818441.1 bifunctional d
MEDGTGKTAETGRDERYMARALELAEKGRGRTSPNPLVGAVIVSEGRVIGEGYHQVAGAPHAEVNAIEDAGGKATGATMYVTLEPCNHTGRTPPCAARLVEAEIARVVMALRDPNPLVSGGGERFLTERGVDVETGVLEDEARRQNEAYLKWVEAGFPFVTLKMAMSLDGKVATRTGDSTWITSEESREDVHRMRSENDAVMVGIGTVLSDDPRLTVRMGGYKGAPLRVVADSGARTPVQSRVADVSETPTLVAVAGNAPVESVEALEARGVEVVRVGSDGSVDLRALLKLLAGRDITSLMVEGGPGIASAVWEHGLVDRLVFYYAPMIIGGSEAPGPIGETGRATIAEAGGLRIDTVSMSGPDVKVVAYPAGR